MAQPFVLLKPCLQHQSQRRVLTSRESVFEVICPLVRTAETKSILTSRTSLRGNARKYWREREGGKIENKKTVRRCKLPVGGVGKRGETCTNLVVHGHFRLDGRFTHFERQPRSRRGPSHTSIFELAPPTVPSRDTSAGGHRVCEAGPFEASRVHDCVDMLVTRQNV